MDVSSYKCPSCGAPLRFDSKTQQLKCSACENTYKPEQMEQFVNESAKSERENEFNWDTYNGEQVEGVVVFTCPSCGGEIIGDENTAATRCPYCDNVAIMQGQLSGMLKPDYVIPFQKTKEDAKKALLDFYKDKKLLPDAFADKNHIEDITGIYGPFWLLDCDAEVSVTYDTSNVMFWSDDKFNYSKTDHFVAVREGTLGFDKIPVDASSKLDDTLMDSIEPFDYSKAVPFGTAYLSGYFADKYDVELEASLPRANERVENSAADMFASTVTGYGSARPRSTNITSKNGAAKYALLPVWLLNTKYEGKIYTFALNGQTGKIVGNLPIDKRKFWKRALTVAAAIAIPLGIIIWFAGGVAL